MRQPPLHSEPVRRHLLAMLASASHGAPLGDARLDAAGWAQLQHMARQHRLEPLLHDAGRGGGAVSNIPDEVAKSWAAAYQESAMRTLAVKATLIKVNAILARFGIACAALKGARLAWHAYPHPALRPMRDLDLLVSPARARDAFQALVDNGFTLSTSNTMPIDIALRERKHLPGLLDPATGTFVELHLRLFDRLDEANADALLAMPDMLLAKLDWLKLGSQQIAFLPATETLLHLVVHSAYDHRFDNGPQIFRDVAVLIESASIDWQRFWTLAREGDWVRGCHLVLRLTEHFMGPQPIEWSEGAGPIVPVEVLDNAALMMLQDSDLRQDLAVQLQLARPNSESSTKRTSLLARLRPPRHVIASYANLHADARGVWLHYPAWLLSRLVRTLQGTVSPRQQAEVVRAIKVDSWLNPQPGSSPLPFPRS